MPVVGRSPACLIQELTKVGIALSAEKDDARLGERILESAMDLTRADGATLYLRRPDADELHFEILITRSLDIHRGGTSGRPVGLPPVPLYDDIGEPNLDTVATRAAHTGETVSIADAYETTDIDLSGTRGFDEKTGYRSISFLTVPMCDHEDEVIGVLQLINAQGETPGAIVPFDEEDRLLVESLASQAATALTKKRLIDDQRRLFESFIKLIAKAVDEKSPFTGEHSRRVPELTLMLADAAARMNEGPLADFTMSDDGRYELSIAAWMHDCGKITTPESVIDKSTKLETVLDRIELVRTRFEVLARDAEILLLERRLRELSPQGVYDPDPDRELMELREKLDEEKAFLERCNRGSESMPPEDQERVREIGRRKWRDALGRVRDLLTPDEVENLTIERGTLTSKERAIINRHITTTILMLESLPYPKHLRRVPEFAGGHHEKMDGTGYPRGLTGEQMSVEARAMAIADVFEALTSHTRPYKPPMHLSEALEILARMAKDGHIDPDLYEIFVREKIYLEYGTRFLEETQIDVR